MDERNVEHDSLQDIFDGIIKPTDVEFPALQRITGNFSNEQIIGEGGFGTVYKGFLRNGEVAVKRIRNDQTIYEKLFQREVASLLNVSHKNIVRFLGFCSHTIHKLVLYEGHYVFAENRDRLLCFEYINNGSLEKYITDELRGLQWETRYSIIKGICEGLQYLHVEMGIIHRDLKPANILIDNNMVAKITDFGLSRLEENAQTTSTTRVSSLGYTAPEYIDSGEISVKYDVYSLGVIIIQLVTGSRSIPDSNNVLRRWRHRLHKLGKETPHICQQIAKVIKIGLCCQENKPYKRPSISEIIRDIEKLESTNRGNNNANESMVGQISPYLEDDMLGIEPLELCFPFEFNSHISCSFELTNETNAFVAFSVHKTSPLSYFIQPNKDIVAPRSKYSVKITLQPLDEEPKYKCTDNFIVRSTKVKESFMREDISEDIFKREEGKLVDEVKLTITYKAKEPQVDVSLGSLMIPHTRDPHDGPQESSVRTEEESKISASSSDEVIQFDPPELSFPLVPGKVVLSSTKIINNTESYVSFLLTSPGAAKYSANDYESVLPPRSTQWVTLTREHEQDVQKDMQFKDEVCVYYAIVAEDIKDSDLDVKDYKECMKLPVVLTKASPCTSNELIQFDPPELSLLFMPNRPLVFSVNIVNNTDHFVAFGRYHPETNVGVYHIEPVGGVMPPRSTQRLVVKRVPEEEEHDDMQCEDKFFLWSSLASEGVQTSGIDGHISYEGSKELPIVYKKTSLCTRDELIQLDPPRLAFPFLPNKRVSMLCLLKLVNVTDHIVGFSIWARSHEDNSAWYRMQPRAGILPPHSTQEIKVRRTLKENETEDMQCKDKISVWNGIVSEGVEASDVGKYWNEDDKELPVVLTNPGESS